ncbi:hypothetical protein [Modicisalibacter sp. MOD 31.J]|uniref:hypothetical protein n=1 Tax=Modicisalibacter sp. MOD 31.J TaxID=2831897 RepID=UPI001CCE7425|nr:hypothetical protein [Modicisalibacter sp. MOD 31.J]MBZ9574575.1 hypothetical protein [Modicisalibacter sp. MOD 31.J]
MFTIRSFGQRRHCETAATLHGALASEYRGRSVAVQFRTPRGLKRSVFVDVTEDGLIVESYGERRAVDFEQCVAY